MRVLFLFFSILDNRGITLIFFDSFFNPPKDEGATTWVLNNCRDSAPIAFEKILDYLQCLDKTATATV